MEKIASFEKVVGDVAKDSKEKILASKQEIFKDQISEDFEGKEKEKTLDELQIIQLVNEETNKLRNKYGMEDFNIPDKNIHIIKEEKWTDKKNSAFFRSSSQSIAIEESPANIVFMERVLHEMLHFKSYGSLQVTKSDSPALDDYRLGLTVRTRDGEKMYFTNLNEAVTVELVKDIGLNLLNEELFENDLEQTEKIKNKYKDAVDSLGNLLLNNEVYFAKESNNEEKWKTFIQNIETKNEGKKQILVTKFGYENKRFILNKLIDKIFLKNGEKFQKREEIFEIFAKGMITGNILPVGKLIDQTFGKGTLRKIGELDEYIIEQNKFIDSL